MENVQKKGFQVKTLLNVLFYVFLAVIVLYSVLALFSKKDNNTTTILGVTGLTVQSNSMSPTFDKGDLIFVDTKFDVSELKAGDVITYLLVVSTDEGSVTIYNSHRIEEVIENDGVYRFITKGDNNSSVDPVQVTQDEIVGVWSGTRWANVGTGIDSFIDFLKSSLGFFLFIVLPVFAFLVYQVVRFIGLMSEYKTSKVLGDRVALDEEALAAARAQIEAEVRAKLEKEALEKAKEEKKE